MKTEIPAFNENKAALWVGLVSVFILALALHAFSTWNWGVGVSHDSVFYLSSADNFLKGNGISRIGGGNDAKPLTHFPPLYPLSLSLFGFIFGDVNQGANWNASLFFALNAALVMMLIYLGTNSLKSGLFGAFLTIISPVFLEVHLEAMSEPIYLTFSLASMVFLVLYFKNHQLRHFIAAMVASSCAYLARYVGVSIVITGAFSLLFFYPGSLKRKVQKSILYSLIAVVPNLFWYLRNYLFTGSFTNRVLAFHPITVEQVNEGLLTIYDWLAPDTFPIGIRIAFIVVFCIILAGMILKTSLSGASGTKINSFRQNPLMIILLLHGGIYFCFLLLSLTFFDSSTRLSTRILSPLYLTILILTVISISRVVEFLQRRSRVIVIPIVLLGAVVFAGGYTDRSWDLIQLSREEGRGFSSASWRRSEIVAEIIRLEPDAIVYTNEAFAVYYLTGIGAYGIPEKYDPVKAQQRDDYPSVMEKMRERLKQPNSALAVFHQGYLRVGMPTLDEIASGLVIAHESRDGVIFVDPNNLSNWIGR